MKLKIEIKMRTKNNGSKYSNKMQFMLQDRLVRFNCFKLKINQKKT